MRKLCIGQEALVYESAIIKQTWAEIIIFWREKQWINDVTSHPTIIIFDGFQICDASATTKTSLSTKILWCLNVVLNNSLKDRVLFIWNESFLRYISTFISYISAYIFIQLLHSIYLKNVPKFNIILYAILYAYEMNLILVFSMCFRFEWVGFFEFKW